MITKTISGFLEINLKLANMRKIDNFTICPYDGSNELIIQSGKRIAKLDLKTGFGIINRKNEQNGAYNHHLLFDTINFKIDDDIINVFKEYFKKNNGEDGGGKGSGITWENKKLFNNN